MVEIYWRDIEPARRFWMRVDKADGCWAWRGTVHKRSGRGQLKVSSKPMLAPRFSWLIHFGLIPDGLGVLHSCDNPNCVRPDHLFLGDQRANLLDATLKGRSSVQKLKIAQVRVIKQRLAAGDSLRTIAADYGVGTAAIRDIRFGQTLADPIFDQPQESQS